MRIVVWITLVLAVAAYICGQLVDPDLWWHITIGRWIVAHGAVPHVDYWTRFGAGEPWRAYSWSIEVLFALIEGAYGMTGLLVAQAVMTLLLAFSAQYVFSKLSGSLGLGSLLAAMYTASCFNHITLRPQTFIWILFIWALFSSERISVQGASLKRLAILAGLMCLWANIHLSAILGLGLIFLWIARRGAVATAIRATLAGFVGTIFTPYLGGEWLTFFSTSSHPFSFSGISEFQAATILQYSTVFPVLFIFLLVMLALRGVVSQPLARWCLAGGFLIGSLAVIKFIPFLMVILCGMTAVIWAQIPDKNNVPLCEGIQRLIGLIEAVPAEGLSFVLMALAVVYFYPTFKNPLNTDITPVSSVDFVQKHQLPFPLLNPFGQGGYVMYRFSNERGEVSQLPSIDGRTNLITKELWDMHTNTLLGRHGWEKYIEKVNPKTILWKAESPLTSILRNNSQWCHVFLAGDYEDGFAIFLQRDEFEKRRSELKADNCS